MMANRDKADVCGVGMVQMKFASGKTVTLHNVLHVPTISKSLVYVGKLDEHGFKIAIESRKVVIAKRGLFVGKGYYQEGMYRLNVEYESPKNVSDSNFTTISNQNSHVSLMSNFDYVVDLHGHEINQISVVYLVCSLSLWHKRLAHINVKSIEKMKSNGLIRFQNKNFEKCETCVKSKFIKKPFPTVKRDTRLLELIHSDICELNEILTRRGKRYFIAFCDDSSWFLYVYLLRSKDEAFDSFKIYKAEVENQLGKILKSYDPTGVENILRDSLHILRRECKAYRLLDENSGVIIESRDVEFFEDRFSKDVENSHVSLVPTSTSSSPVEISREINEPRRSTRARKEKSLGSDFFSYLFEGTQMKGTKEVIFSINIDDDPKIFSDAMSSRDAPLWKEAINDEVDSILGNLTFLFSRVLEKNFGRAVAQLEVLEGYSDASWVNHTSDSKSTSGWIYTLAGGAVSWASKKQTCISHSTMETEFIALAAAGKEVRWMRDLLPDIQLWPGLMPSIPMYCDSQATLSKAYNSVYNGKLRHIRLRHNYVRQVIENGTISVVYVKSCRNLADPLTKPLTRDLVSVTTRDMGLKP
nr:retrotransposon ribonuclease H [Tanacetum cinerariifolium]